MDGWMDLGRRREALYLFLLKPDFSRILRECARSAECVAAAVAVGPEIVPFSKLLAKRHAGNASSNRAKDEAARIVERLQRGAWLRVRGG